MKKKRPDFICKEFIAGLSYIEELKDIADAKPINEYILQINDIEKYTINIGAAEQENLKNYVSAFVEVTRQIINKKGNIVFLKPELPKAIMNGAVIFHRGIAVMCIEQFDKAIEELIYSVSMFIIPESKLEGYKKAA